MADLTSEEIGLTAEELYRKKYECIDADIETILSECDSYILAGEYGKLSELFNNSIFMKRYSIDKYVAYISVAVAIYELEREHGRVNTIFDIAGCVEGLVCIVREIKLHLWRLEFAADDEAVEWICANSLEGTISRECITELASRYSVDKVGIMLKLVQAYGTCGLIEYAQFIVQYIDEKQWREITAKNALEELVEEYGL